MAVQPPVHDLASAISEVAEWGAACTSAPADPTQLTNALRTIRNAPALGQATSDAAVAAGAVEALAAAARFITPLNAHDNQASTRLATLIAQALANYTAGPPGGAGPERVWRVCWPSILTALLAHPSSSVHEPAVTLLYNCARRVHLDVAESLLQPRGQEEGRVWGLLLRAALQEPDSVVPSLGLLLAHLCAAPGQLRRLLAALAGVPGGGPDQAAQLSAVALHLLAHELSQRPPGWAACAAELPCVLLEAARACSGDGATAAAAARLEAVLECLKQITAQAAPAGSGVGPHDPVAVVLCDQLQLHTILLALLARLGPVRRARRSLDEQASDGAAHRECAAALPESVSVGIPTGAPPYDGYRGDLLAVLGNLMAGRARVADHVAAVPGAVTMLLSQCQLDDASPVAREWGLWAMRGLCTGSAHARQLIAELQPVEGAAVQTPEMAALGIRLEVDPGTGKWEVVRAEGSVPDPVGGPHDASGTM